MNIKYISLLSLLCVAGAQCTEKPAEKKFDIATNAYRDCRKSWDHFWGYGPKKCGEELKAFEQAKEEFLNPHRENMKKSHTEALEYQNKWENTYYWRWPNIQKKYCPMYFKMVGHNVIIEAFEDKNGYTFLNSNKSTDEFAEYTLNNMLTTEKELSKNQLNSMFAAKYEIMEMIKQQA